MTEAEIILDETSGRWVGYVDGQATGRTWPEKAMEEAREWLARVWEKGAGK